MCLVFGMWPFLSIVQTNCFNEHAVNVSGFFEKEREGDVDIAYHFQIPPIVQSGQNSLSSFSFFGST